MKSNHERIRLLTLTGMLTALTTVATMVIRIPTPTKGYINLGDTIVNLCAWILGGIYGAFSAGFGSALADLISGYAIYAPATFVIKFLMALVSFQVYRICEKKWHSLPARILGAVIAEIIMVTGYALFAGMLNGSVSAAWVSVPENIVQGVFGAGASVALYELVSTHVWKLKK